MEIADGFEVARHFRVSAFDGFSDFFALFLPTAKDLFPDLVAPALSTFRPKEYLSAWSFYSDDERTYRYLRDEVLKDHGMSVVLARMMAERGFRPDEERHRLWMTRAHVRELSRAGHVIGLHSTSHPMTMASLPAEVQDTEYRSNVADVTATTGERPFSMAHPCNSYSPVTLEILRAHGIEEGFCTVLSVPGGLESPRQDAANLR